MTSPPTAPPREDTGAHSRRPLGGLLARAAAVTALLSVAGSLAGLVRDQTLAHLFGAGSETDAFLVAWTVPEFASTLLIEDAMALVMVPAFSVALAQHRGAPSSTAPVRRLVTRTGPALLVVLALCTGAVLLGAPYLVAVLAPGIADPQLAVRCTRFTALTLVSFGAAGYLSAALRAHHRFLAPATIYLAYNLGILAGAWSLYQRWGVTAAACGVALGGVAMVLVQLPSFVTALRTTNSGPPATVGHSGPATATLALVGPVAVFAITRQAQVLIERYLASDLPSGAISHLNYAQKVAQVPMVLSLMVCTVTFPVVARAMAEGAVERARRRVESDLVLAALVVLAGVGYVLACAPALVELLFQRGAFGPADTEATASVMRVYALGLLGHSLTGALARPFFSAARPTWYPALAMAAGLALNVLCGALTTGPWGVWGVAASNAAGISLTAVLLLRGLGGRLLKVRVEWLSRGLAKLLTACAAATLAGLVVSALLHQPWAVCLLGALVVPAVFLSVAAALDTPEVRPLWAAATLRRDRVR